MQKFINIDPVDSVEFRESIRPEDYQETKLYNYSGYSSGGIGGGLQTYVTASKASLGSGTATVAMEGGHSNRYTMTGTGTGIITDNHHDSGRNEISMNNNNQNKSSSSSYTAPNIPITLPIFAGHDFPSPQKSTETTSLFSGLSSTSMGVDNILSLDSSRQPQQQQQSWFAAGNSSHHTKPRASVKGQKEPKTMKKSNI